MPSTKIRGTDGVIYQASTKVGARNNIEATVEMSEADASDHDSSSWGDTVTTTARCTVEARGWLLVDDSTKAFDTGQKSLMDAMVAGTALAFSIRPAGTGAGKAEISGNFRVSRFVVGNPQDGVASFDLSLRNSGTVTIGAQSA